MLVIAFWINTRRRHTTTTETVAVFANSAATLERRPLLRAGSGAGEVGEGREASVQTAVLPSGGKANQTKQKSKMKTATHKAEFARTP